MTIDDKYMRLALRLAKKGMGRTSPNPLVGAVVVQGRNILGRGYHRRAGEAHAEILALRQAGKKARGATLYLNLEPCAHFGKTPPCTEAILNAGIQRVVAGMKDPNPLVSGRGIRQLRRAGVQVDVGILREECQELNAPFGKFITTQKPFVTLKAAISLDGKVATRSGDSRWISSEASRNYVHHLRQVADAVMVGIGTVLKDDPLLTVRLFGKNPPRHPLRVIVDSRLRIPFHSKLVRTAGQYPTLVATTEVASSSKKKRLAKAKLEVLVMKSDAQRRVSLKALMEELARRGVVSILLEGGSTLNASALREKLVDRLLFFVSPKIIGGHRAPGVIGGEGILRIEQAESVKIMKIKRLGPDLLIEGALASRE
ncbi:MAG: bifunctional diaminohydroxyphosphoribosylaminopyrimidine deaminase/5-amino-6-(5-phosphoribosylamino)uracil reductase RibD [Deltaproteobacteria bacterium]|nr:bifunctional diaminohydroxyphosphoribosylaminopyrimidine deaminase/5-amino-6-(5-phosphoribosylamino)uracil reductase RibD [Deltaproteobacteria bacterium]